MFSTLLSSILGNAMKKKDTEAYEEPIGAEEMDEREAGRDAYDALVEAHYRDLEDQIRDLRLDRAVLETQLECTDERISMLTHLRNRFGKMAWPEITDDEERRDRALGKKRDA